MAEGKLGGVFSGETALLVIRVVLAAVFMFHGGQKMFGWFGGNGWDNSVAYFVDKHGIPQFLAAATIITEFVGGACILLGLLARFWGAGLAIIMINAIALVHFADGWKGDEFSFAALWKGNEFQLSLMAMGLAVFLGGPGRWALADFEGWLLGLRSSPK